MKQFALNFLIAAIVASTLTAQNAAPGTRCFIPTDISQTPRCNRGSKNTPPTVTLSVNPDDKRNLELCARSKLSDKECSTLLANINLWASANDPDDNNLLFTYTSTGGRITSEGHMAVLDLLGPTSGTYTTTVEVDDGCGCVTFSSATVTIKMLVPKWLNGIWEGTGYQWETETAWPMTFSAADNDYRINYPSLNCSGKWLLLNATLDSASYKEEITIGAENCAQGDTVRIKKLPSGELGARYTHVQENEPNAAALLKPKPPAKKPMPIKTKKVTRTRK